MITMGSTMHTEYICWCFVVSNQTEILILKKTSEDEKRDYRARITSTLPIEFDLAHLIDQNKVISREKKVKCIKSESQPKWYRPTEEQQQQQQQIQCSACSIRVCTDPMHKIRRCVQ